MNQSLRILPHSIEAEQSVLGSMLLDKDAINIVFKKLEFINFYKEYNANIFESMLELAEENKPIDIVTVTEKLNSKGYLDDIGIAYITSLTSIVPTTSNIEYYINIIQEKYVMREGIKLANDIINKLYSNNKKDINKDISNLKRTMSNNKNIENTFIDASSIKRVEKSSEFISSGFNGLDRLLGGGFKCTSFSVLTGEPGSGKSSIINQMIAEAISKNYKSFLYSGELPGSDLIFWFKRTVSNEEHIVEKISKEGNRYFDITDHCWDLISDWIKDNLYIYGDDSVANKNNILSAIEYLAVKKDVKLFVLDNLMTFDIGDHTEQYRQQKQLCLALKALAKKYWIAIVLVAHPRKPTGTDTPTMYDVSGASEIIGTADTVIRTMRSSKDGEKSKILLLKNRWGGISNRAFNIDYDERRKRFYTDGSELDKDYGYDVNK